MNFTHLYLEVLTNWQKLREWKDNTGRKFCDEQKYFSDISHASTSEKQQKHWKLRVVLWRLHSTPLSWNGTTAFHTTKAKGFQSALYTWMNNSLQAWPAQTAPSPPRKAELKSQHKLVSVPLQRSLLCAAECAIVPDSFRQAPWQENQGRGSLP